MRGLFRTQGVDADDMTEVFETCQEAHEMGLFFYFFKAHGMMGQEAVQDGAFHVDFVLEIVDFTENDVA